MKRTLFTLALMLTAMAAMAQTENPRGIYKMTYLTGKMGEMKAPFDQYKICTDSITMMLQTQGNLFGITDSDHHVFNYTGEAPDPNDTTATRIYDSNAEHFTEKWYSTTQNHMYFPENGWCIEYYESGKFSETAKEALDALSVPPQTDAQQPLIGTWRILGMMDELNDAKKLLKEMREDEKYQRDMGYLLLTPTRLILFRPNLQGAVQPITYDGKKKVTISDWDGQNFSRTHEHNVTWLEKNCFAMELRSEGYRTDYEIWERVTDPTPLLNKAASIILKFNGK